MRFHTSWRRAAGVVLSLTVLTSGCVSSRGGLRPTAPSPAAQAALAEFVQKLPPGSIVHVERAQGGSVRGTLLKATADAITVQPRTRLPEPPIEIAMQEVVRVQPESNDGRSVGKAVGIGAAAGGAAALGVLLVLLAIFSD